MSGHWLAAGVATGGEHRPCLRKRLLYGTLQHRRIVILPGLMAAVSVTMLVLLWATEPIFIAVLLAGRRHVLHDGAVDDRL